MYLLLKFILHNIYYETFVSDCALQFVLYYEHNISSSICLQ